MPCPPTLQCSPALSAVQGCVPVARAWPATAGRLRERDAARLNIGPRQATRP